MASNAHQKSNSASWAVTDDDKHEWLDITPIVEECASSLTFSNPILCTESFSLQDSMAAMELRDRKMDSCEVPASQVATSSVEVVDEVVVFPRPTPTNLDDDFKPLPWNQLTTRDAAFIVLESLVRLESMLSGASVLESIFTCLYAHNEILADMRSRLSPTKGTLTEQFEALLKSRRERGTLAQHVVYSTSLALVELTEILRSIILHADIYEEEDFAVNTHNITFFINQDSNTAINELTYSLQLVENFGGRDRVEIKALQLSLGFLLNFLTICSSVARVAGEKVREVMEQTKLRVGSAAQMLKNLQSLLGHLNKSDSEEALLKEVFDPFVNRPLLGNSPVRKVVFRKTDESIIELTKIVSEVDWVLCDFLLRGTTLGRIRRILDRISRPAVNILSRSLIVLNLYFDDKLLGQYPLLDLIKQEMQTIASVPDELFQDKHALAFLNRLAKPVYDTLKLRVLNRNRQRAYMEAVMIQDWSSLQQEAHLVDVYYRRDNNLDNKSPAYFSHYVLSTLIELMDLHVALGVEVGLFQGQEDLATVYWYRDFLLSTLLNNWTAMRRTKLDGDKDTLDSTGKGHKSKKKGVNKNKDRNGLQPTSKNFEEMEYEFELMILGMKRGVCRGLVRFIAALRQSGLLRSKHFQFTTLERQFQKRFELFAAIQQPPPLTYDDYLQGSDFSRVCPQDLLLSTSECFKSSKTLVGKLSEHLLNLDSSFVTLQKSEANQLAKVCVGNSVYVEKLKQTNTADCDLEVDVLFDFTAHADFCTIKLV